MSRGSNLDVNVIATGSTGNCVTLTHRGKIFLLDAGISWAKIARGIQSRFASIDGVFVSHEHMDHAKEAKRFLAAGTPVICSKGTAGKLGLGKSFFLRTGYYGRCGDWEYIQVDMHHDAEQPTGIFLNVGNHKVFYATDTYKITCLPAGVTVLVVECNYDMKALKQSIDDGVTEEFRARRVLRSHLSLESLLLWLRMLDKSNLQEIYIVHGSSDNSEKEKIFRAVAGETGIKTKIGVTI